MCILLSSHSSWENPRDALGELLPCSPVHTLPNPTPVPGTHIFRETHQEPSGATLRRKKEHRASAGSDRSPRTRNPLDLPSGSDSSSLREGKCSTGDESYNKWVYFKQARQALDSFSAEPPVFPPHGSASEEDSCLHTVADHQSHHVPHLSNPKHANQGLHWAPSHPLLANQTAQWGDK